MIFGTTTNDFVINNDVRIGAPGLTAVQHSKSRGVYYAPPVPQYG